MRMECETPSRETILGSPSKAINEATSAPFVPSNYLLSPSLLARGLLVIITSLITRF